MRSDITSEEQEATGESFLSHFDDEPAPALQRPPFQTMRLLWEYRAFILQWAVRGFLIALCMALVVPNRYKSTVRLMPPDSDNTTNMAMITAMVGRASPGLSGLASDILGGKNTGALFVEALQGRTVEDRVINRFDLRRVYGDRYMQDARSNLEDNTTVAEDRKSGVITIVVNDRDSRRSSEIARAYVDELNRVINDVSTSSARRERIFIERRLSTVKQDLHHAAEEFSQFASQNTTLDLTAQTKATVEAAATLEGQLIAAQSELESLSQVYTDSNVRVRSLRARIDELRSKLQELRGHETSADAEDASPDLLLPSIRKLPLLGVRWAELYQEAKIQETVYQLLTQQYEMAKIQEAKEIPTVKVLDDAVIPEKKSFPPRLGFLVLGTALGMAVGGCWVYTVTSWRAIADDDPVKVLAREVAAVQRTWAVKKWGKVRQVLFRRGAASTGNVEPIPAPPLKRDLNDDEDDREQAWEGKTLKTRAGK